MAEKTTRMTRQRKLILEELRKLKTHPTADEIYSMVRAKLPRISLGTVYRNLQLLTSQGEIRSIPSSSGQTRYDGDMADHFHIRCRKCGKVVDLPYSIDVNINTKDDGEEFQFDIVGYKIELIGDCRECAEE